MPCPDSCPCYPVWVAMAQLSIAAELAFAAECDALEASR